MLEIAPEKVAHVIIKAREYDTKVAAWDDTSEAGDAEDDPNSILEEFANDPTRAELAGFISRLNVDEQAHLVARGQEKATQVCVTMTRSSDKAAMRQRILETADRLFHGQGIRAGGWRGASLAREGKNI